MALNQPETGSEGKEFSPDRQQIIQSSIGRDLAEGILAIRFDGVIEMVNEAALRILEKKEEELAGRNFAQVFFTDEENDAFTQSVLDTVYHKQRQMESYVPYHCGSGIRQLRIVSSFLHEGEEVIGILLVISDITELTEMRDAVRAMNTIRNLNRQLEIRNQLLQETFGRYLSDDVVREILESPDGWKLGGQKRCLSVMMSDLRGFTVMSERMDPQDLITMLNHYFSVMYEAIERYRGTLIEFLGDGMMVVFGAPAPNENHASDAVSAAVEMQRSMEEVNRWNRERGFETLSMGIGINTDEMILGNIGSERRTKYGVLGAAVNLAGRIEGYTTGGQIFISAATREAVPEELEIRSEFRVWPKGLEKEITLFDVTGIRGEQQLSVDKKAAVPLKPVVPAAVRYIVLEGKYAEGLMRTGRILALSDTEAVLEPEGELAVFDNLRLDLGDGLYAKVTEIEAERCRICFTARPPEFDAWKERLCRKAAGEN